MANRVRQVSLLGNKMLAAGVPVSSRSAGIASCST